MHSNETATDEHLKTINECTGFWMLRGRMFVSVCVPYVSGVESRVQAFAKDAADEKALRSWRQVFKDIYTGGQTFVVDSIPPESVQLLWFKRNFPKPLSDMTDSSLKVVADNPGLQRPVDIILQRRHQ